jgi:hypothetical protein
MSDWSGISKPGALSFQCYIASKEGYENTITDYLCDSGTRWLQHL